MLGEGGRCVGILDVSITLRKERKEHIPEMSSFLMSGQLSNDRENWLHSASCFSSDGCSIEKYMKKLSLISGGHTHLLLGSFF